MKIKFGCGPGFFRFLLALAVFVHHTTRLNLGDAAVFTFFILSGYWVSKMWQARYSRTRLPYYTYLISRGWRLLPVFILCSAISWSLLAATGSIPQAASDQILRQVFSNLAIFGYNSLTFQANIPAWSLDVEMQFYLIAPLVVGLLSRSLVATLLCAVVSAVAALEHDKVTLAPYLVFFSLGAAAALGGFRPSERLAAFSLGITVLLFACCLASPYRSLLLGGAHPGPYTQYRGIASVVVVLALFPWAIFTTTSKGSRHDGMFADLSYIVYLTHWPIIRLVDSGRGSSLQRLVSIAEALTVVLAVSWLIWKYYDRPINRMRAQWVARRAPRIPQAPAMRPA